MIYAIASIACWGFVNVLDSYLIERKIWENCWDGMVISSQFKIFGVLIFGGLFFGRVIEISYTDAFLSIMGGALISSSYIFCFATMLYYNDVPLVQLVWNLSSPLVVVRGYFFLGKAFSSRTYFGMAIVFLGALAISFSKDSLNCRLSRFALLLIPMVVFYSVSEVLMKFVEETRNVELGQSFPFLCLGQVLPHPEQLIFPVIGLCDAKTVAYFFKMPVFNKKPDIIAFFGQLVSKAGRITFL